MLEVCVQDIESVVGALDGGADRLELCAALEIGGLTPSEALLDQALRLAESCRPAVPVNVLIRGRGGDFVYSDREIEMMAADAAFAVESGAAGIVFGCLDGHGDVDEKCCRKVLESVAMASRGRHVNLTFHRAFDECRDPRKALEAIIALGFDTVLTSGLAPSAPEGVEMLRSLKEWSAGRITILVGSGVTPASAPAIMSATCLSTLHASCKRDCHGTFLTDAAQVASLKSIIDNFI